jgi:FkbM family methyltransferase
MYQAKNTILKVLFNIINWYTQRYPFPKKGWKYFKLILHIFHLSNKIYKKKICNGRLLYVNVIDHIQKNIFWYGYYEKNTSLFFQMLIKENSIILDIGANIGYFSVIAADKAMHGQVYSFEPVSLIRKQLLQNISLNRITNIHVLPFCVNNENGISDFFLAAEDNIGMSGLQIPENYSGKKLKALSIVLDDWISISELKAVDFVKIDIEGAEKKALEGMSTILQQHRPIIFIEIVATLLIKFDNSIQEIYNIFSKYGYQPYEIIKQNELKPIYEFREGYDIVFVPIEHKLPEEINIVYQ